MSYLSKKRRRDMRRQRWQFIAVGATVAIGVMMYAASYDSYQNLNASYQQTYDRLAFADTTITGGDEGLPDTLIDIDGVKEVMVRHTADLPVTIGDSMLRGRLVGMPVPGEPTVNNIGIEEGVGLSEAGAYDAVAEVHIARTFELEPGDTFTVALGPEPEFTIVGTASSPEYIWPAPSTQEVFADPEQFGVFFIDVGLVSQLPPEVAVRETLVLYDKGVVTEDVDAAVHAAAEEAGATGIIVQADHPSHATLQLDVDGFGQMAIAFPILFLTAAGMAVYVLLTRIVFSQRALIGTLRASGMSARKLRRHYLGYGVWLGLVGSVIGVLLGAVQGRFITKMYTGMLDIPDTVVVVRPGTIIVGLLFGLVAGSLSALVPARSAYGIAPAEAMRGEAPMMTGGSSLVEKAVPPLKKLPVRIRMTLRGIGRSKRRSLSTVLGVVFALVLVLASGGLIDTIVDLIHKQFEVVSIQDATVFASEPVTEDLLTEIDGISGVKSTEHAAHFQASISGNGDTFNTTLQGFAANTQMHGWTNPLGYLPAEGLLAGNALAEKIGVEEGDLVTIGLPAHDVSITLEIVEFVDEPMGMPLYAQYDTIVRALGDAGVTDPEALMEHPTVTNVLAGFEDGRDREAIIDRIEDSPRVLGAQDSRSLYNMVKDLLGLFYAFTGIMLLFGGIMAFSLMFNTISVNVAERSTEFATLKASGMSNSTIAKLVAGENLLLTTIGIIPGLLLGIWVSSLMLSTYNNDSFHMTLTISPITIVVAAVGMFIVALLSMIPGIRSIKRLDVGAVVRERAL
ncbi:MAG: FtsX-like permease family protein [Actinomycetota bacterium]